jgi:CHAT domain-containing protein
MIDSGASRRLARQIVRADDLDAFVVAKRRSLGPDDFAGLKGEVDRLVEVDLTKAAPLANAIQKLAGIVGDAASGSFGDAAVAQVHYHAGRLAEAEPLFLSAVEGLRVSRRPVDAAAVERQLVGLLHRQGRAQEALNVARKARRTLTRAGESRLLAQLENNVGSVHYYTLASYRTALGYFERAHSLLETLGDERSMSTVDYNRANVLLELDRPQEAIEIYELAERRFTSLGMARAAAQCTYMSAYALSVLGRFGDALRSYFSARERLVALGDRVLGAWCNLYLAELHARLNLIDEAADLAAAARAEFEALDAHEAEAARALLVRARVSQRRRDHEAAAADLVTAQATFDQLGMDVLGADARLGRAELAVETGHPAEGLRLAEEAGAAFGRARLVGRRTRARIAEASALMQLGRGGHALRVARTAVRSAARLSDPWLECRAEALVGELEIDRGHHEVGVAALERSVAGIERLRLRLRPGEARAAFLADKLPAYEQLVAVNLKRNDAEGLRAAFRYVEMAKSRALADLMAQHMSQLAGRDVPRGDAKVRQQISERLEQLNWYSTRIDDNAEKGGTRNSRLDAHFRTELTRCERELVSLFSRLEIEDAGLAGLLAAEPASLDDLSRELASDDAAVEYFFSEDRLSAFVVTRDGAEVRTSFADRRTIERHVTGLRFQLEKFGLGSLYAEAHRQALRRSVDHHLDTLYHLLFEPIAEAVAGKKLTIVPHGALHYVPLHALRRPSGAYLIEDTEISYAPSATVHRLCERRVSPAASRRELLAVGLADEYAPHIAEELASIGKLFGEQVLLEGSEATKSAFLENAPGSRYLHLATHGQLRQDNPMFSSVRLDDGPLNFYDVFDLTLDAELVTLSACNTGVNRLAPGDELSGLMRGFLYAGAPSLVVSLWAVNDRSTCELMQTFYRHLQDGNSKRSSLRLAQLESLERYGHPYYWAPFILMGKTS